MKHLFNNVICTMAGCVLLAIIACAAISTPALASEPNKQRTHYLLLDSRIIEIRGSTKLIARNPFNGKVYNE